MFGLQSSSIVKGSSHSQQQLSIHHYSNHILNIKNLLYSKWQWLIVCSSINFIISTYMIYLYIWNVCCIFFKKRDYLMDVPMNSTLTWFYIQCIAFFLWLLKVPDIVQVKILLLCIQKIDFKEWIPKTLKWTRQS